MAKNYTLGLLLTVVSALCWGFSGACAQYLFTQKSISPDWLTTVRLLFAGVFILLPLYIKRKNKIFKIFKDKRSTICLVIFAIFGLMFCQYTYFLSISYINNAAITTALQYTAPAMIVLFISFYYKKLPSKKEVFALISAMIGVFLLATKGDFGALDIPLNGLLIGLISAVCVCIYTLSPIKINQTYGPITVLGLALIIGGIFSFFYTRFWTFDGVNDLFGFLALFGVVFFGTMIAFGFYMVGVSIIGATRASLIASIEPISAAFFIYFWLGAKFVFFDYIGFGLIIFCTILLAKK